MSAAGGLLVDSASSRSTCGIARQLSFSLTLAVLSRLDRGLPRHHAAPPATSIHHRGGTGILAEYSRCPHPSSWNWNPRRIFTLSSAHFIISVRPFPSFQPSGHHPGKKQGEIFESYATPRPRYPSSLRPPSSSTLSHTTQKQ